MPTIRVAVLGASPKPDRYSNKAVRELAAHGHEAIPVHPAHDTIEGLPTSRRIEDIDGDVDTVSVYMRAAVSSKLEGALIALSPRRVIFNPGAENKELAAALEQAPKKMEMKVDEKCPACGAAMVRRWGRRGFFLACSNYPECKNALWDKPVPEPCPQCGSPFLLEKVSQRQGTYYLCPNKECGYRRSKDDERREAAGAG